MTETESFFINRIIFTIEIENVIQDLNYTLSKIAEYLEIWTVLFRNVAKLQGFLLLLSIWYCTIMYIYFIGFNVITVTLRQWTEERYLPSLYYNMAVLFHISTYCVSVILSSFILTFFSFLINLPKSVVSMTNRKSY